MKLEVGKTYLSRDGKKVKIFERTEYEDYPFGGDSHFTYTAEGKRFIDVDTSDDLVFECVKQPSEVDQLKARVAEQEQQLQAYETQLTLQEEGPKSLLERCERQKRNLDYYAKRVAELEAEKLHVEVISNHRLAIKESAEKERDQLRAELEALKPKPVVIETCLRLDSDRKNPYGYAHILNGVSNLKLTFTDGVLTSAEVIK